MPSGYSSNAIGGVLTPERVIPILFDPLAAAAVVLQATPANRIFDAEGGAPVRIPRIASLDLVDPWRSENTQIDEVDPVYDELTLLPSSLKSLKAIHRLSNELARNSIGNAEDLIGSAFIKALAREVDRAMLVGDGADNTIVGLANQTGIQAIPVGSEVLTIDLLYAAEQLELEANGDPATAVWFMNPGMYSALRRQRDNAGGPGTGQYLIQPDPTQATRMTLLGHPVFVTTQIPTDQGDDNNETTVLLVDMAQIAVGRDLEPRLDVFRETYANYDQVALRVVARMDIGALNPDAIVALTGLVAEPAP